MPLGKKGITMYITVDVVCITVYKIIHYTSASLVKI